MFLIGAAGTEAQTYASWIHHRAIFFNTTASGANVAGNVANFPVRIHLDAGNFDFAQALPNGEDIRFEDPNGTVLPYQIEAWNQGGQVADIWVRVPQVDGNSGQDFIRMHWGKPGATSESNGPNVFQTSNDFAGVWHLNEDGNNSAGGYPDATGNGYHGTGIALNTASDVPGLSGNAQNFNSASNQGINFGAGTMLHPSGAALTVEAWFNANSLGANRNIIGKPYTSPASPFDEYLISLDGTGTKVSFTVTTGGVPSTVNGTTTLSPGTWYHVVGVYDGTNAKVFLNGVMDGSTAKSGSVNNFAQPLTLGKYFHDNSSNFDGKIEEPRVMGAVRSADWIKLTHAAMKPSSNLVVMGPRVWDGGGADDLWSNPANWNGDILPTPDEDVLFNATSSDNVTLDQAVWVRSLIMTPGYAGNFSFASYSLTILEDVADFRSSGTLSPGSGQLIFEGPNPHNFHPMPGTTFPAIVKNGGGTAMVVTNHLTANGLTVSGGTFDIQTNARNLTCQGNILINGGSLMAASGSLDVMGDVTLSSGTLSAPNSGSTFNLDGSFTQSGGTLNSNGGTVVFDGPASGKTVSLIGTFGNVTFNGSGSWTAGSNLMANSLTLISGTFDLSTRNATLTGNLNVNGGTLTAVDGVLSVSGNFALSGGSISMPSGDMTVSGNVTRTGGTATHNNGWLKLTGAAAGKTFNFSPTLNNLNVNGSGGSWTVSVFGITAVGLFQVQAGTFNLGSALAHSVGSFNSMGGNLDFNSSTLSVSGNSAYFNGLASVSAGSGTLAFTGSSAKTFTPKSGATHPNISIEGTGTVTLASFSLMAGNLVVNSGGLDLANFPATLNGNLIIAGGGFTATNASPLTVNGDLTLSGGTFDMPSGSFYVSGSLSRTGGTAINHWGTLHLTGSGAGKTIDFSPMLFSLVVNGAGGVWTVVNNGLNAENAIDVQAGTLHFGSGLTHATYSINSSGGTLNFGSSTVRITGSTAYLDGLASLVAGTGVLEYPEAWLQTLTAKAGATNPTLLHSGSGTLRLLGNALLCNGFTQTNGVLDLNGFNITTAGSSNFQVGNGNSASLANLAGRTITVGGNATLSGASAANRLNLDAGAAWYLDATGTLSANLATLANGNATGSAGTCVNCANAGTNSNWTFNVTWDGGGSDNNWTTPDNWGSDAVPTSQENVVFDATSVKNAILDAGASVSTITFTSGYTGNFSFGSSNLTITGPLADFRTGGGVAGGSGALTFIGSSAHFFHPPASGNLPDIIQNGSGTTTLNSNGLNAANLTLNDGYFILGSGLSHQVTSIFTTGGTLDFGSSTLMASGAVVDLSGLSNLVPVSGSLLFNGSSAKAFTPPSFPLPNIGQTGTGTTTVTASGFTTPGLSISAGTLNLGSSLIHNVWNTLNLTGGGLAFSSSTLKVGATTVDLSSLASLSPGSGTLELTGSSSQTLIPKSSATHPAIRQFGTGTTTVTTNSLSAGTLFINNGIFNAGAGLNHTFTGIVAGSGGLDFNSSTVGIGGATVDLDPLSILIPGTGVLSFISGSAQSFHPKNGSPLPRLRQAGGGTTTIYSYNVNTPGIEAWAGSLDLDSRTVNVNGNVSVTAGSLVATTATLNVDGDISMSGGTFQMPSNSLLLAGSFTRTGGTLNHNSGTLLLDGTSGGKTLDIAPALNNLTLNGSGGAWAVVNNGLALDGNLNILNGTLALNSLTHSVAAIGTSGGVLNFGSGAVNVTTGNAVFSGLSNLLAGTATLIFTAGTGTQSLEALGSTNHPHIVHNGAGTLRLMNNNLNCLSFTQNAGTFHFNSYNLTTVAGGDFILNNGNSASITGLTGRTLTVDGDAAFNGASSADKLGLNPGASWVLNVIGTATAQLASVDFSNATGGSAVACSNCANLGSNNNWTFAVSWDGGGSDANWTTPANWGSDAVPGISDDVTFNAGPLGAILDANATIRSFTMTSGYSGSLDFGSSTLSISGNADFRSSGGIIANSGTLSFNGTGSQTFIPKSGATFPNINQNGTAGITTVTTNALTAGNLTLAQGTFHLGNSLTHTVGSISGSGTLDFGASNLNATGNVNLSSGTVVSSSSNTLAFTGASPQSFTPNSSVTNLNLIQNGAGGTTVATADFNTPSLTIAAGTLNLGVSRNHSAALLTITGGGLDFGSSTLQIPAATVDLSALAFLDPGTGTLRFTGSSAQTFTPKASGNHPHLIQYGAGGTTLAGNITAGSLTLNQGTFHLGSGLTHTFASVSDGGGGPYGSINFGSSLLQVSGTVSFYNTPTLTVGTGSLAFNGASGTQNFTPKSGGATHPPIQHGGASTLRLYGALTCLGFSNSAGTLDFNANNIATVSAGDFTVANGNASTFAGLGARTLTVAGNATFTGASAASPINLNPGASWTLAVTGTLNASLASLDYSNASVSQGSCVNCANGTGNNNWTTSISWDGGGADNNWSTTDNWGLDAIPTSADNVVFDGTSTKNVTLDGSGNVGSIKFTSGYTGTFSFGSNALNINGAMADLRSGGSFSPGSGLLYFLGGGSQTLIPPASGSLPDLQRTSTGTLTLSTNPFVGNDVFLHDGIVNLGSGLTHTVHSIDGNGAGTLDFGSSNLNITAGGTADFGIMLVSAAGSSTLSFTGSSAMTYIPRASLTTLNLAQTGTGTTTVTTYGFITPSLTLSAGTFQLGASLSHGLSTLTATGGTLDFGSSVLTFDGTSLDFSGLAGVTAGTGSLDFNSASAQAFIPKTGATFPAINKFGTGTVTLTTNPLTAGNLTLNNGTFHLGSSLTHTVGSISGSGALDFGTSNLNATGNANLSGLTVTAPSNTLAFTGSAAQTFTPKTSLSTLSLIQNGAGGTTVSAADFVTPALTVNSGTFHLGSGRSHSATTFSAIGGGLDFGSSLLSLTGSTQDFSGLATVAASTGTLAFTGSSAQTFTPKAGATFPDIGQNGTGGTTVATHDLQAGTLTVSSGTWNLGTGLDHTYAGITATGGGLAFGSSILSTYGDVDFSGLATLTAGSGTLSFTLATGTQVFIPKNGAVHPLLSHIAAGTLQLSASDLTALGYTQTAGVLDLNGRNLTLSGSGNLAVSGHTDPFTGLGGRTLTVGGYASLVGLDGSPMNLNPASSWNLAVTGSLTAVHVRLRYSQATVGAGTADSSFNEGGNSNWTFLDDDPPDNVTGFLASAADGHSVALSWNASASADADSVMLRYRTDGSYPSTTAEGTLWRKVSATETSDTVTGLSDKAVYHFAAFVKDSSGNYSAADVNARDTARTPDVTPPTEVTTFTASTLTATSVALSWTASADADADSVMIRYATGLVPPADTGAGSLWRKASASADRDTVTGLATNAIYAFSAFVRDSSGNYGPGAASARDTALVQVPVLGTVSISDVSGHTRDADPALSFTWSGADSVRFALIADSAAAAWKPVTALDSMDLGADGQKIVAAQFKNVFGHRSAWMRDTTVLDRQAPAVSLELQASYGRWNFPAAVSGKSKDSQSGNDIIFVIRRRISDGYTFNGASWTASPDTAEILLTGADSLFSASMPVASMATGEYEFTVYAQDRLGNKGAPVTQAVHYEDNRIPALAFGNLPDTLLQNQAGAWKLDFGDLDPTDSLAEVSIDAPAWLSLSPGADTTSSPWAVHRTYSLSGKPLQAHVGANSIQVRVQDRGGLTFTYTRTVFVADANDAPVFEGNQAAWSVKEDSTSAWKPKFKDEDSQDSHTLAVLAAPAFAQLSGPELTFKPGSRDVGTHTVRLTVSDGKTLDTLETALTVVNVNDAPYAFHGTGWKSPFYFKEDKADTFTVVVVDMDRNEPVILATQLPAYVKVASSIDSTGFNRTFRFVVKPTQSDTGSLTASLSFVDAGNVSSQLALNAHVLSFNDTPSASIEEVRTHAGAARCQLTVSDEDGSLEKARFHYRLVGPTGDTLRRGITASSLLALHPLADGDYRLAVKAEDQDGLRQAAFTTTSFTITGATALSLDTARWHMIGVPHASLPASVLPAGATLASWDEVGDDGQPMARYASGKTVESLKRGKGYWVRLTQPVALKAEQKDLQEGPFSLRLTHSKQGWNQVANPYPYWVDVSASRLTFWEWDADKRDLVNAKGLLKPWAAYWVLAPRDTVLKIADAPYFPASQGPLAKGGVLDKAGSLAYEGAAILAPGQGDGLMGVLGAGPVFRARNDWSVQLALRAGAYHDRVNAMGVRASGMGNLSGTGGGLADAPKFGEYIALHFEKDADAGAAQGFAADYRSVLNADEEWWDFSVENSGTGQTLALLTPAGLEPLAAVGLRVFLVRQGEARPVEPGETVSLAMEGAETHYSLVVTPHADFASRLKGAFTLAQNFPNPVTTFTAFRFILPQSWDKEGRRLTKDFNIRINLYDHSGRQVAKVASGKYRPGAHTLLWRPASASGGNLAKGSYIYRLETPGFVKSMKLVLE